MDCELAHANVCAAAMEPMITIPGGKRMSIHDPMCCSDGANDDHTMGEIAYPYTTLCAAPMDRPQDLKNSTVQSMIFWTVLRNSVILPCHA